MSDEFLKFTLPLIVAIMTWGLNEWRKVSWERYQRKETNYKELVRCLKGFYAGNTDAEKLKGDFLNQLNQCWLYCPDEVIKKGYAFLDTVHTDQIYTDSVKEKAMGDLVAAIREDLLREDFFAWELGRRTTSQARTFDISL